MTLPPKRPIAPRLTARKRAVSGSWDHRMPAGLPDDAPMSFIEIVRGLNQALGERSRDFSFLAGLVIALEARDPTGETGRRI